MGGNKSKPCPHAPAAGRTRCRCGALGPVGGGRCQFTNHSQTRLCEDTHESCIAAPRLMKKWETKTSPDEHILRLQVLHRRRHIGEGRQVGCQREEGGKQGRRG